MKKTVSIDGFVQVSEDLIRAAAEHIPLTEESGLRTVLKAADEYKAANMTPIFILDQYNMDVMVVAKETFGKKLH
jgi:hypothetical protein